MKAKSLFTARNIKRTLPFVDAGLEILSNIKPTKHYARALRAVTSVTAASIPDPAASTVRKLALLRAQIKEEKNPRTLTKLRIQQDTYTDLLIEQLQGA